MWKNKDAAPALCFIGCPHLTYGQLVEWTDKIAAGLKETGAKKVKVRTVLTTSPDVADKFRQGTHYVTLIATGAKLSSICPLMYTNNPLTKGKAIATTSNKLRTYSIAKYYKDADMLDIIVGRRTK